MFDIGYLGLAAGAAIGKYAAKQTGFDAAFGGGNWLDRFGIKGSRLDPTNLEKTFSNEFGGGNWRDRITPLDFNESLGGGNWLDRFGMRGGDLDPTHLERTFNENWGGGKWLTDRLGGSFEGWNAEGFKKNWEGGNWTNRLVGSGGTTTASLGSVLDAAVAALGDDGGNGNGTPTTTTDAETLAKGFDLGAEQAERDRLAKMRRMLAGRYGRAETNLTGGTGFGSGSQRTIGGYS